MRQPPRSKKKRWLAAVVLAALGYIGWTTLLRPAPDTCQPSLDAAIRLQQAGDPRQAQAQLDLALHACTGASLDRAKLMAKALEPAIAALEACDRALRDAESQVGEGRPRSALRLLIAQPTRCATRPDVVRLRQAAERARQDAIGKTAQALAQSNDGQIDAAKALVAEAERLDRDNPDLARLRMTIEMKSRALAQAGAQPAAPPAGASPLPATPTPPAATPPAAQPAATESPLPMAQLLAYSRAGQWSRLDSLVQEIKAAVSVPPGDRRASRAGNTEGLLLLRNGQAAAAVPVLRRAVAADPSDVEVANNLGYALLQAGQVREAVAALERVIAMAPDRTSAWANYSETLALGNNEPGAASALRIAVRFSADRQRSIEALSRVRDTHPNPVYARVLATVLNELESIPRSPSDRSRDAVAAQAPVPAPAVDARRIECETLVRAGQRALAGRGYDLAMQHADDALSVSPGCPGAQELARQARQAKDQARAGVIIR